MVLKKLRVKSLKKTYVVGTQFHCESTTYVTENKENSGESLDKLKARDFNATSMSTCDFSTFYTTLPNNLNNDKLIIPLERSI